MAALREQRRLRSLDLTLADLGQLRLASGKQVLPTQLTRLRLASSEWDLTDTGTAHADVCPCLPCSLHHDLYKAWSAQLQ